MIEFKILKKSKQSRARLGLLKTDKGVLVRTPALVPVATQAVVKTLTAEEAAKTKSQILIANTFHLHLRPGEKLVKQAGGLARFMNWPGALMTDSGGFQVFSLGFGRDFGVGKVLKYFPGKEEHLEIISRSQQPRSLKISSEGVYFQSPLDGQSLFLGPKESIKIQEQLGADIIFAFDECTTYLADFEYVKQSLQRTHHWAEVCLATKKSRQAIFGIVQGSRFKQLRQESARFINALGFDGFGLGGDLGKGKETMLKILNWTILGLDEQKPRHLLGIGHLEDIVEIIKAGIDLFDCTVPTHYARRGIAFGSSGKLDLRQTKFLKAKEPLDRRCSCFVCQSYQRGYISHLFRAKEITGLKLLTFHNLYFFNTFLEKLREKIKQNQL